MAKNFVNCLACFDTGYIEVSQGKYVSCHCGKSNSVPVNLCESTGVINLKQRNLLNYFRKNFKVNKFSTKDF